MPLDIVQSVVFMSFAAAGVSGHSGTSEDLTAQLTRFLEGGDGFGPGFFPTYNVDDDLQLIGGDWSVVWGPIALLPPGVTKPDYVANAMYVAHSPSQKTYVVAVAGTAHSSVYDWAVEDADVTLLQTVRWSKWVDGAPHDALISGGTNDGLHNLLSETARVRDGEKSVHLRDFLRGVEAGSTLIATGHSLGGALSPALALLFHDDLKGKDGITIRALPLAGPTPGNGPFADLFEGAFEPEPEPTRAGFCWNCDIHNVHDLVPRAWNDLQSARPGPAAAAGTDAGWHPSLWGDMTWEVAACLTAFVDFLSALPLLVGYRPLNPVRFADTFGAFAPTDPPSWVTWPEPPAGERITCVAELSKRILASHYDQYIHHFGLVPLPQPNKTAAQSEADALAQLKRSARVAAAQLNAAGTPPTLAAPRA